MFKTIRWRLAASYALLVLLSVTLMAALALSIVQRYVGGQEREALQRNAEAVAAQAADLLQPPVRRIALEQLASVSAFLGDARVKIVDAEGETVADSGDPGLPDEFLWLVPSSLEEHRQEIRPPRTSSVPLFLPLPSFARNGRAVQPRDLLPLVRNMPLGSSIVFARRVLTPWGRRFVFEGGTAAALDAAGGPARRYVTTTATVGEAGAPLGRVELSGPLSLTGDAVRPLRAAVLLSGLGSLLVALGVGLVLGRTISEPLGQLSAAARRMAGGDLGARAPSARRDEIGALARQFNGMAESLEASFRDLRAERDSLRRFIADASHELRTPITALATFNELLQGSAAGDADARAEFLRESGTQIDRLRWITANLLDLSRLDAGIAALAVDRHAAGDILDAAAAVHRAAADDKGVSLAVEAPAPAFDVTCDRDWVEIALANLAGNAVKFTPRGGSVTMGARVEGRMALFTVRDDGPGIPADELPRIFERFFRGRDAGGAGAGLGLAIAKSVAMAHGGTIDARSEPGTGSTFTFSLPLGGPAAS